MEIERLELTEERIDSIMSDDIELLPDDAKAYFVEELGFCKMLCDIWHIINDVSDFENTTRCSLEELASINEKLYAQIMPDRYKTSFTNPEFAVDKFGLEKGQLLSAIAAELRAAIPYLWKKEDLTGLLMRTDLMLETYSAFVCAMEEEENINSEALRQIFYYYYEDYYWDETSRRIRCQILPDEAMVDLDKAPQKLDLKEMYLTGEYISANELEMYRFLCELPKEQVKSMADTYTEGYIKGFQVSGRDISIKETVELRFNLGFIPMLRFAYDNFRKVGLKCSQCRAGFSIFTGRSVNKNGVYGGNPNPQFDFDHKNDYALIISSELNSFRLETTQRIYEDHKHEAKVYGGPAVVETFGEEDFIPVMKKMLTDYSEDKKPLIPEYASKAGQIVNQYIPGEERSFTIIAYPVPSIGPEFNNIFRDTIKINTLDYIQYRDIQQRIIDALDKAEYVHVLGQGDNKTDLWVKLHTLTNPEKQTNFENCVADVNIPVGEVFTSPVLSGTKGTLHVTSVFLNSLEYHNLSLDIKDGMITGYSCDEGSKLIEDYILFHHDTLPMGECAIGTNTTAYAVGRKYGIEAQLPILIAEKTGPHFAFGDTCYSHSEDLAVYNPDGKEIIARDNECSLLRDSNPEKAYFNCHTDITIPYDELGLVEGVTSDGDSIVIISNGRFVLAGCEALNEPLEK